MTHWCWPKMLLKSLMWMWNATKFLNFLKKIHETFENFTSWNTWKNSCDSGKPARVWEKCESVQATKRFSRLSLKATKLFNLTRSQVIWYFEGSELASKEVCACQISFHVNKILRTSCTTLLNALMWFKHQNEFRMWELIPHCASLLFLMSFLTFWKLPSSHMLQFFHPFRNFCASCILKLTDEKRNDDWKNNFFHEYCCNKSRSHQLISPTCQPSYKSTLQWDYNFFFVYLKPI